MTDDAPVRLHLGDCLGRMADIPDGSVSLIVTDPPYHRVKSDGWDRQWKTDADYLDWIGRLCGEWRRVLKPNGSLYCFASPRMAARVECRVGEAFEVLNRITWRKDAGWAKRQCKDEMRAWFPSSESIIFAEQRGSDSMALGESGYEAKCDQLRGFVFEPLRAYLDGERERAGVTVRQVAEAFRRKSGSRTVTGMAGHWFGRVQWMLPTAENYEWLRGTLSALNHDGQYLRREYEDLRREYEDLRRPFAVSSAVPYTDVWDFPTVPARPGKHPCAKPLAMLEHIVAASSRPGDLVLDSCMGGGTTGIACVNAGRRFIGIEQDPRWFAAARRNIDAVRFATPLLEGVPA